MNHERQHRHHPPPQDDIPPFFEPILQYYNSLPPLTWAWLTLSLLVTTLQTLDVFEARQLVLQWDAVLPPRLEPWRILTSFAWAGPGTLADFPVLMLLYSLAVVVPGYEGDPHEACRIEDDDPRPPRDRSWEGEARGVPTDADELRDWIANRWLPRPRPVHRRSDCAFAFLVCTLLILATHYVVMETSSLMHILRHLAIGISLGGNGNGRHRPILLPVFTRTLLYSIITLDSLKHPDRQQNINFFPVPGRYVPLFHVAFGLMMGYRINETVHGIAVGLVYSSLVEEGGRLASLLGRKRVLCTPHWLIHLVGEDAEGNTAVVGGLDDNANNGPHQDVALEPGANFLHCAATIGDVDFLRSQASRTTTPADAAPFRQRDRNGWQPLHEAARAGRLNVLKLLLEVVDDDDAADVAAGGGGRRRGWRRMGVSERRLHIDINARTNNERGYTALRLVEENHGGDGECAAMLRGLGGMSLGFGDGAEDDE